MIRIFFRIVPVLLVFLLHLSSCGTRGEDAKNEQIKDSVDTDMKALNSRILEDPNNAGLYNQRATIYLERMDFDAAEADLKRAMKIDSSQAEFYITQANIYFAKKDPANAKKSFEKCISLDSLNSEALMKLAEIHLYLKQHPISIEYINKTLRLNKYNAKGYFMKGMNYKELGDTAKAISSMITAVEQDQKYYAAYVQLGMLHAAQKNKLAMAYYENALKLSPNSQEVLYNEGIYLQNEMEFEKAKKVYDALLKINPNYAHAHFNLGVISLKQDNYDAARIHFDNAIKSDSRYSEAYFGRATSYEMLGNKKAAFADYTIVLELKPGFEPAIESISRLRK